MNASTVRIIRLAMLFKDGARIRPSEYAEQAGVSRAAVYNNIKLIQKAGLPVKRLSRGVWGI